MPKFFTKIVFVVSFLLSAFNCQYLLAQRTDFSPKYLANVSLTTGTLVQAFNPLANTYTINVSSDVNNVGIKFTTDQLGYLFLNWKTPIGFSTANPAITGYANQSIYYNYAVTDTPYTFPVSVWYVGRTVYTGHSPSYYDDAMNYFFTIHRIASKVLLTNIAVNGGELSTNFDPLQPNYDIATTDSSITIKPTIKDSTSIVTVNGHALTADGLSAPIQLSYNTNANIAVKVTATDSTSFTYNLNATRIVPPNLALSALTLSKGTLSPQFNSNVIQYTADVNSTVSSINLTPVLKDPSAIVAVNGVNVASGQQSADIPLQTGDTPVTVVVKSTQDSTQTYSVTVKHEGAASLLKSLTSSIQLDTAFTPTDFSYTATVNYDATNISLTPTAAYAGATVYINGAEVTDGTANSLPLAFGNNIFTIAVTGTDLATKTYTLSITRLAAVTLLTDIKLDAGTLSPVFDPLTWTYSVNVNAGRSEILVTPVTVDSTAIVKVNGQLFDKENSVKMSLNEGLNITTIVVTKEGDIDRTYTLNVNRAKIGGYLPLSNIPFVFGDDAEHSYTDAWFATVPSTTAGFTPASINGGGYLNSVYMSVNNGGLVYAGYSTLNYGVNKVEITYAVGPRGGPVSVYDKFYYITRLQPQIITLDPQNKYPWDKDFIPATSTTTNPITYTSSNPSVATVSEGKIHITGVGVTTITATQPGDAQYEAASVTKTLTVGKKAQLITFAAENKILTDKDFVAATTSSKLALIVTSSNPNVATVINGKVHLVGAGTTTITASQAGNDTYDEATSSQTLTVTQSAQTISFIDGAKTLADTDFVAATIPSQLPIIYTSSNKKVATIVNGKVHIVGVGTTTITASQAGNSIYTPVTQSQEFTVTQAAQTIAFVIQTKTYGDADFLPATTTSGLPITYSSADWDIASIADGKIHIEKAGKVVIWADQPGSKVYSVAESVSSTITINKAPQIITFAALNKNLGDADFAPAMVNSKLPLTYTSSNAKVATIVNGKIHLIGLGTASITASQKGNENYIAASLSQAITVTKASQTITFAALTKNIGDADFSPATISSALVITYTSSNSKVATIVKGKVHIVGVGTATITASQTGDGNYTAAKSVAQTLTVSKASQTITFAATAAKTYGDADFAAAATASSKLPVTYTTSNTKIATIVSGKMHIIAAGIVTITATQVGNDIYAAAKSVSQKLTIAKAQQTATFAVTAKTYGDADFVPAKASTGLPLSYISSDAKVASLVNGKLHIVSAGSVTLVINQPGNTNYEDLTLTQKFTIAKANLTITADNKSKKAGAVNPTLTATYKGFVNGDDKTDLTTQPKLITTATTSSKAGSYIITASGAAAKNYGIAYVSGKLTVTASAVKTNSFDIDAVPQPVVTQALSPNGDGLNDVLTIANIKSYPDNTLTVMDVNGNNVYEVKGYDNQERVFDGHSSKTHAMQKQGTYYYILQYKDGDDSKRLTGYIIMKY